MSLYRLVSRLAVVSALNNYMAAPWPTLAGPNIFDSKIEPVEDMAKDRAFPCCVVYTDYDKDHWSKAPAGHKSRMMTVTLELLIVQTAQDQSTADPYKLECPFTDSEIETSLDIFETQIFRALGEGTEASDAFNYICPGVENVISRRGASIEGGQRLAARQITLEMKTIRENIQGTIPPQIAAFLDRAEQHPDYADRIIDIRAAMTSPATKTPNERYMQAFGYSRDTSARLGRPVGPQVMLPANLTFTLNTGG
ncbi:exported protein of unknown function [Pseudorhizobium banfieldiae]|uniref:Uncharacterized protein n=1 Tax=Pseudorhizobium banfieldiae TaxID=1125847 RepID=L0NDN9_9HYPH|nr:hypothetical protein [Pseudorhizobium banfieldiae]CAD6606221.1 hypothetical protein RNT25_01815 [arsenite-oxidising bacterium NT-25]CCF19160.1 exported protein of unknown function [Pseudorhizobium banfieldiae]